MSNGYAKRTTVYLESALLEAIRLKAVHTKQSISEVVNNAVRVALSEDHEDISAFKERLAESTLSLDMLVKELKVGRK